MRRRRPVPLLLLFLLVTAAVVYVFLSSFTAEREYTALVHELGSGEGARVLESTYSRGLFNSRANTAIESEGMAGVLFRKGVVALGAVEVRPRVGMHMSHEIEHGMLPLLEWIWEGFDGAPVLARMKSKVELDQETQLALAEVFGKLPAIEATTVIRTSGQAHTEFTMPAERLRARGEALVKRGSKIIEREGRWEGLDGELDFAEGFRSITGVLHSPGFESRGDRRIVKVGDITWAFSSPAGQLPLGKMNVSIGEVLFDYTTAGTVPVELHDLDLDGESKPSAGTFGAKLKISLRALRLGDDRWGPGSLEGTIANVDGAGFRQLRLAAMHLRTESDGDPAKTAAMAASVLEALPQLLAKKPKLEVERLQLKTPVGLATGSGRLSLVEPASSHALTAGSFLDGEIRVDMPASALEDMIDAQVRAGLAAEGADLSDEAAFEALAQQRRAEKLAEWYRSGFTQRGDRAVMHLGWGASAPAAPPPPPAEKTTARPGRRAKPQPARAEAPAPAPAPAPAAPAPAAAPTPAAPAPAAP